MPLYYGVLYEMAFLGTAKGLNWRPISKSWNAMHFSFGLRFLKFALEIQRWFYFYTWNNFDHYSIEVSIRSIYFISFRLNYIILHYC